MTLTPFLDELIAKAGKATRGPWAAEVEPGGPSHGYQVIDAADECSIASFCSSDDAAHIAACSPALIIALAEVAKAADEAMVGIFEDKWYCPDHFQRGKVLALNNALSRLRALAEEGK